VNLVRGFASHHLVIPVLRRAQDRPDFVRAGIQILINRPQVARSSFQRKLESTLFLRHPVRDPQGCGKCRFCRSKNLPGRGPVQKGAASPRPLRSVPGPMAGPLSLCGQRKGRKKTAPVAWSLRDFPRTLLRCGVSLTGHPWPCARARTSCRAPLRANLARSGASARSDGVSKSIPLGRTQYVSFHRHALYKKVLNFHRSHRQQTYSSISFVAI
jgi:hypothetical protein